MATFKSLIMELLILAMLLCSVICNLPPADAAVSSGSNTPAQIGANSSSSNGAPLLYDQAAISEERSGTTREWIMQSATTRGTSKGSTAVSTNATRIVLPAAGAQSTVAADAPSLTPPTLPTWVWALIPIAATVILASVLVLRTIFGADEYHSSSEISDSSSKRFSEESYEERGGARTIPIKGPDEPSSDGGTSEAHNGLRARRIRIDDSEEGTNSEPSPHR